MLYYKVIKYWLTMSVIYVVSECDLCCIMMHCLTEWVICVVL